MSRLLVLGWLACFASCRESPTRAERLVVFAAASLRDAFTAIGDDFVAAHPGVDVTFNFAGSQDLRTSLEHGAAADVFAAADWSVVEALVRDGRLEPPAVFARNEPVLVVSTERAAQVRSLADLPRVSRIVLGAQEVPIGRYSLKVLENASKTLGADFRERVEARVVSRELSVRQVLAKVVMGEAEAGIVYRSDVRLADGVSVATIPAEYNVIAEYPIAAVTAAAHGGLARAWVEQVLSSAGQARLRARGFLAL